MRTERCSPVWKAATSTAWVWTLSGDIYAGLTVDRGVDKFVRQS